MAQQWYCKITGSEMGPLTSSQLMEMVRDGRVQPSTSVRMADSTRWVTAGSVKGLFKNPDKRQEENPSAPAAAPPSPLQPEWYYTNAGQQLGPVSDVDLKQLVATKQILPATQVWREGMPEWVAAHTVPGLCNQRRPGSITVFGILNCVFGGLGLAWGLTSVLFLGIFVVLDFVNTSLLPEKEAAFWTYSQTYSQVLTGLNLLGSIWLLCSGIGLLRMRSWGRTSSIAWCYYSIVNIIQFAAVIIFFIILSANEVSANESPALIAGVVGGTIVRALPGLVYTILLLVFMLRPNVRAAFQ